MPIPLTSKATSHDIDLTDLGESFSRVDIEFEGLDHSGASYEGRVFLNNPDADTETEPTEEAGYAGSFHVFGHGGCWGDEGHCQVAPRIGYDLRPAHALWPTRKVVIATEAVRRVAADRRSMTVTVVPVVLATTDRVPEDQEILKFETVSVISYL